MRCSVARTLGSTLIILVAGANILGYWQRVWGNALGSIPLAVGMVSGKTLD
jgi:hypothetical protein